MRQANYSATETGIEHANGALAAAPTADCITMIPGDADKAD